MSNEIKESLVSAFLKLDYNNPDHKKILDLQRTKKYIKTNERNYLNIYKAGRKTGLIK